MKHLKNILDNVDEEYIEDDKDNLTISNINDNNIKKGDGLKLNINGVNPILLFNKLRVLLGAKQAGHNNVKDEVNKVLKRLTELGLSDDKRNKKIINKYFDIKNGR